MKPPPGRCLLVGVTMLAIAGIPAFADPGRSLMFTAEELSLSAAADQPPAPVPPPDVPAFHHLASIVPAGNGGWRARIGGSWRVAGDSVGELRVRAVSRDEVRLEWRGTDFRLRPNQTLETPAGVIREGRPRHEPDR